MKRGMLIAATAAVALVAAGVPAGAQSYSQSTIEQSTSQSVTTPDTDFANNQAMSIHDRAVELAHEATAAAQAGHRKQAEALAARAEELFCQTWSTTGYYAHRTGMSNQP